MWSRWYVCIGTDENGAVWVRVGAWAVEQAEKLLAEHNTDPTAHPDLRDTDRLLDSRLSLLELMFNTDVSGNPFTATFESLAGLTATGIWNEPQKRLEF